MIVRFWPTGRSFKGLGTYLVHDPGAQTTERVAWMHTFNLAHEADDMPSAIHEMFNTFRNRDLIKEQAGVRRGGSAVEKPVKHFSLNWHPDESPTREHMIETVTSFLKEMGWGEYQCALVAHSDKKHKHVHVMLGATHPERGTRLNDAYERRRAQEWALGYEREHGIFCAQRLKPIKEREKSLPRPAWEQLQGLRNAAEGAEPHVTAVPALNRAAEWLRLKKLQKEERLAFQADRRRAYSQLGKNIYRQIRELYRSEWRTYYGLKRAGASAEALATTRAAITANQQETFKLLFERAAAEVRVQRAATYRTVLDQQKQDRSTLTKRQDRGLPSLHLLARPAPAARAAAPDAAATTPVAKPEGVAPPPRADARMPPRWTNRAGLVAQQRSATRWLDRAARRIGPAPEAPSPRTQNRLHEAVEKLRQNGRGARPGDAHIGIEPDG